MTARGLWFIESGRAVLRKETICRPSTGACCTIRSLYSAVSSGSEQLVAAGKVPPDMHETMRVPYMGGAFPFPVKYGYSLVASVEVGPPHLLGKVVHLMHPHQDRAYVDANDVFPVPDGIPARRATLASNMETAVNAVWDARPALGERILIVGFGFVGALIAHLLHTMSAELQIAEVRAERREMARQLGYQVELPRTAGEYFDLAFHSSGTAAGLQEAIDRVGMEGRVVELSWYGTAETPLRLGSTFHSQRKSIISSQVSHLPGFQTPRWNQLRRKQLVFSLLRDAAFDDLLQDPLPFDQMADWFHRPLMLKRGLVPVVAY